MFSSNRASGRRKPLSGALGQDIFLRLWGAGLFLR